ncbi:MAG: hypothetical protein ACRDZ7_00045 [Acidimicrobiia bacterium]
MPATAGGATMREKLGCGVVAAALILVWTGGSAHAAELGAETCYLVADGNMDATDGAAEDLLTKVDRSDPDPATNETDVGTGTGTFNIEAIALQPGTGVLFAANAGTMGTIDTTTGLFEEIGPVGSGSGALGEREMDDIDGLSFDATTGFLYGTERRRSGAEDFLLRIDPATGVLVPGGIGGEDYAVVEPVAGLPDLDAIAVDPLDGTLYGVANDDGRKDHLVRLDKETGEATDIGVMGAEDVEGLGFASGQLIGATGKVGSMEGIWDIDKASGAASNRRPLDNARDYESFDCLNAPNPTPPVQTPPGETPPGETPPVETPPGETPPPPLVSAPFVGEPVSAPYVGEPVRAPQANPEALVTRPGPMPPPIVANAPELPRTGREGKLLVLASGLGLALGGLAVVGATRRPALRKRRPS